MGKNWMSNYANERSRAKLEKKAIVERMFNEGATREEMAKATGYTIQSVGCIIMELRYAKKAEEEIEEERNLVRIKRQFPNLPRVEHFGKMYLDITDLFLSSEWLPD